MSSPFKEGAGIYHRSEVPQEIQDVVDAMCTSDNKNCPYRIGDKVRKCLKEPKDVHQIGDTGTVLGNMHNPLTPEMFERFMSKGVDPKFICADIYAIHFDNDIEQTISLVIGSKLEKI